MTSHGCSRYFGTLSSKMDLLTIKYLVEVALNPKFQFKCKIFYFHLKLRNKFFWRKNVGPLKFWKLFRATLFPWPLDLLTSPSFYFNSNFSLKRLTWRSQLKLLTPNKKFWGEKFSETFPNYKFAHGKTFIILLRWSLNTCWNPFYRLPWKSIYSLAISFCCLNPFWGMFQ